MDKLANAIPSQGRIELAREADFHIGSLWVRPSRREISGADGREVLQPRVMQVLVALARSPNEVVSQRELINRCWNGLSVSDDAIGRCIAQLRRLATTGAQPPVFTIETIPGVGYRINPRAMEAEPEVRAAGRRRRIPWALAGLATVTVAAIGTATWWFGSRATQGSQAVPYPTIAVGAFQPADGGPAAKAYAATLTGEVSDATSHYNLVVIGPANVQGGTRADGASGADFLVEGRVVQKGTGRTITSDLVDARHGVVVYSFDTPAPPDSKVDVAAEIAARVAHALDPTKLTNDLNGKLSASDYTLVARANDAIDQVDMPETMGLVQALAKRHPQDGDLQAAIAIAAAIGAQDAPQSDRVGLVRLARASAAKAAALRPDSALLHVARQMMLSGALSYAAQEQELRKAKDLDPNLHVTFNSLGDVMMSVGRTSEGVALITRSIQLDPMSEVVIGGGFHDYIEAGARDEAIDALGREEALFPEHAEEARYLRYWIALYTGTPTDVAAVVAETPKPIHASIPAAQRDAMLAALVSKDPGALRRMVAQCFANFGRSGDEVGDQECLLLMVEKGALDDAFRFAQLAYPDNRRLYPVGDDRWLIKPPLGLDPAWLFTPRMKPFRDDPRFWDVAVRAGLVDYWRSTGVWPDMCQTQLAVCRARAAAAVARDQTSRHST